MINPIDFIHIPITPEMDKKAREMADGRRISKNHPNPNDEYVGAVAELAVEELLIYKKRAYKANDIRGKTDNGVDIEINAGTINVKASEKYPSVYQHLLSKTDTNDTADYFVQCFVIEGWVVIAGMEARENFIAPEYLGSVVSNKWNLKYKVYRKPIWGLTIKPAMLIHEPYTLPIDK